MPLHDWGKLNYFAGVHTLWMAELVHWIKPRLPAGYRVFLGTSPTLTLGRASVEWADVSVRNAPPEPAGALHDPEPEEPEVEVAAATLDPRTALFIERDGWMVAAVEIISHGNKDAPDTRDLYTGRYLSYLMNGTHLLLIDVQPRPRAFSFADRIAKELAIPNQPPLPAPMAIAYRVGNPAPEAGRFLGMWRRPLEIGQPMPTIPLPVTDYVSVTIDLEQTYMRAAATAYLT